MTLSDVTRATGIDKSDLSKVERGKLPGLGPKRANALARCLKVPLHVLSPELDELKRKAQS